MCNVQLLTSLSVANWSQTNQKLYLITLRVQGARPGYCIIADSPYTPITAQNSSDPMSTTFAPLDGSRYVGGESDLVQYS